MHIHASTRLHYQHVSQAEFQMVLQIAASLFGRSTWKVYVQGILETRSGDTALLQNGYYRVLAEKIDFNKNWLPVYVDGGLVDLFLPDRLDELVITA